MMHEEEIMIYLEIIMCRDGTFFPGWGGGVIGIFLSLRQGVGGSVPRLIIFKKFECSRIASSPPTDPHMIINIMSGSFLKYFLTREVIEF